MSATRRDRARVVRRMTTTNRTLLRPSPQKLLGRGRRNLGFRALTAAATCSTSTTCWAFTRMLASCLCKRPALAMSRIDWQGRKTTSQLAIYWRPVGSASMGGLSAAGRPRIDGNGQAC